MKKKYKVTFWIVIIALCILLLIIKVIPFISEVNEETNREHQERVDYSNNWSNNFCIENGYEGFYPSGYWGRDYCTNGTLLINFEKKWNYTGLELFSERDKIVGGMFVPN